MKTEPMLDGTGALTQAARKRLARIEAGPLRDYAIADRLNQRLRRLGFITTVPAITAYSSDENQRLECAITKAGRRALARATGEKT